MHVVILVSIGKTWYVMQKILYKQVFIADDTIDSYDNEYVSNSMDHRLA